MLDRFSICEAAYLFASDYHGGQGSKIYEIFGRLYRLGFRPSPLLTIDRASDETMDHYECFKAFYNTQGGPDDNCR